MVVSGLYLSRPLRMASMAGGRVLHLSNDISSDSYSMSVQASEWAEQGIGGFSSSSFNATIRCVCGV